MAYLKKVKLFFKKFSLLIILTLIISSFTLIYFLSLKSDYLPVQAGLCNFKAELATRPIEQYRGLSNREEIAENEAMLFLFNDLSEQTFVMRNMNFPLDIIFIRDNKIVNMYRDLEPEGSSPQYLYESKTPVDAVLEIKAGRSHACQLDLNTKISW